MKSSALSFILIFFLTFNYAQKPPLDSNAFNSWASAVNPSISNDGKYALYFVRNNYNPTRLVIRALNNTWKFEMPGVNKASFTEDSRGIIVLSSSDSLYLGKLGTSSTEFIAIVSSYNLFMQANSEFVSYRCKNSNDLAIRELCSGRKISFVGLRDYVISNNGKLLVFDTEIKKDSTNKQYIHWRSLVDSSDKVIWSGFIAENLVLDAFGEQVAFTVHDSTEIRTKTSLWYYKSGDPRAIKLVTDQTSGINGNLELHQIASFSKDGGKLFILLRQKNLLKAKLDAVDVDIWSYRDSKLQSQQLQEAAYSSPPTYLAVVKIKDHNTVRQLQEQDEKIAPGGINDSFVLLDDTKGDLTEVNWSSASQPRYSIVSVEDGRRRALNNLRIISVSPNLKFILGYDLEFKDIFCFNVATGNTVNVTQTLPVPVDSEPGMPFLKHSRGLLFAKWLPDDQALTVYDKFDIWRVDPLGKEPPIDITNGYGRKRNITFRFAGHFGTDFIIQKNTALASIFDNATKNNGFCRIAIDSNKNPEILTFGPYIYSASSIGLGEEPIRARDANLYIVQKQSIEHSPNYFWTSNFNTFVPISFLRPENNFNWLKSELITFKTLIHKSVQGVLYKPEDFDPKSKYPVIIHYYSNMSNLLNEYRRPGQENGDLDIAWFVSHGYLVFTPDIHSKIGQPGESAYNSIVAAARYLATLSFINKTKIGLQGHSFGGYETNYLITHCNLFAAAVSSSGATDLISVYGDLWGGGQSIKEYYENRRGGMGVSLWERPDLYIKNSPIFKADKVQTPVLLISNKRDHNVPFQQGVDFFTALRRLGKEAWMLQYDKGGHGLADKELLDYNVRMTQFFDYYLKGALPAKWMTQGIPASLKGIDDGLELDKDFRVLGPGLLIVTSGKKLTKNKVVRE